MKMANSKWQGHTNRLPPNFTFIGGGEWWDLFDRLYHVVEWDIKWLTQEPKDSSLYSKHLKCFLNQSDRTGFGYMMPGPFFFKFYDCDHDYDAVNIGKFLQQLTCRKCGTTKQIDSS